MLIGMASAPYDGYKVYKVFHRKQGRTYAMLYRGENDRTTLQWARYLMAVKEGRILGNDETVDHINGDRTDDRIENLQILSRVENIRKSAKPATYVTLECPHCGVVFSKKRNQTHFINGRKKTFCSRACSVDFCRK